MPKCSGYWIFDLILINVKHPVKNLIFHEWTIFCLSKEFNPIKYSIQLYPVSTLNPEDEPFCSTSFSLSDSPHLFWMRQQSRLMHLEMSKCSWSVLGNFRFRYFRYAVSNSASAKLIIWDRPPCNRIRFWIFSSNSSSLFLIWRKLFIALENIRWSSPLPRSQALDELGLPACKYESSQFLILYRSACWYWSRPPKIRIRKPFEMRIRLSRDRWHYPERKLILFRPYDLNEKEAECLGGFVCIHGLNQRLVKAGSNFTGNEKSSESKQSKLRFLQCKKRIPCVFNFLIQSQLGPFDFFMVDFSRKRSLCPISDSIFIQLTVSFKKYWTQLSPYRLTVISPARS